MSFFVVVIFFRYDIVFSLFFSRFSFVFRRLLCRFFFSLPVFVFCFLFFVIFVTDMGQWYGKLQELSTPGGEGLPGGGVKHMYSEIDYPVPGTCFVLLFVVLRFFRNEQFHVKTI